MFAPNLFRRISPAPISLRRSVAALLAVLLIGLVPTALAAEKNEDGLPLPRFASTRSSPINVRVGPGLKYDIAWVYTRPDAPVEIIAEFDIWRKVRDFDGTEGWIQQNLLSGNRVGLVEPWQKSGNVPLRASESDTAGVRAWLAPRFQVNIRRCDGKWCQVDASASNNGGHGPTYTGFLPQSAIWGVYQGEQF